MSENIEQFKKVFDIPKLDIFKNDHWTWSLRPKQPTLGSGILSLNTYAPRLSEITPEAGLSFVEIVRIIENTLFLCFNYDKINYLMLMMIDNHVHYHIIPRYKSEISFGGKIWLDKKWPVSPNLTIDQINDENAMIETIKEHLKSNLFI